MQFINIVIMNLNQVEEQNRLTAAYQQMQKYLTFREDKYYTAKEAVERVAEAFIGCFVGHQVIYALQGSSTSKPKLDILGKIIENYKMNSRATQYSSIVFANQVIINILDNNYKWYRSQYEKGGLTGLISYLINRPIDQIRTAKMSVFQNEGKRIGTAQAIRVVILHDGFRGFYKYQNLLGPINSILHRSIYFGLYHRLVSEDSNTINAYLTFPFLAALGASLTTLYPDKIRTFYLKTHIQRNTAIQRRTRKILADSVTVTDELFECIRSGKFQFSKQQLYAVGMSALKNWVLLSCFVICQNNLALDRYFGYNIWRREDGI